MTVRLPAPGLCLEPPQVVTGLARVPNGTRGENPSVRFEQYERRLRDSAAIPDEPDWRWVDDWLHRSYTEFWASLP